MGKQVFAISVLMWVESTLPLHGLARFIILTASQKKWDFAANHASGHDLKSAYNSMNLPASFMWMADSTIKMIERRGTLEDIMRRELEVYEDS